jgi:hypothetical protein
MLYWVHLAWQDSNSHLVVIGTDCTSSCKSNNHTIMTTTDPCVFVLIKVFVYWIESFWLVIYSSHWVILSVLTDWHWYWIISVSLMSKAFLSNVFRHSFLSPSGTLVLTSSSLQFVSSLFRYWNGLWNVVLLNSIGLPSTTRYWKAWLWRLLSLVW